MVIGERQQDQTTMTIYSSDRKRAAAFVTFTPKTLALRDKISKLDLKL